VTTGSNWIRTANPIRNGESGRFENISNVSNLFVIKLADDAAVAPVDGVFRAVRHLCRSGPRRVSRAVPAGVSDDHKVTDLGRISRFCLECAAIFRHLPLTVRCGLGTIQER
jgi:hypothetical protein